MVITNFFSYLHFVSHRRFRNFLWCLYYSLCLLLVVLLCVWFYQCCWEKSDHHSARAIRPPGLGATRLWPWSMGCRLRYCLLIFWRKFLYFLSVVVTVNDFLLIFLQFYSNNNHLKQSMVIPNLQSLSLHFAVFSPPPTITFSPTNTSVLFATIHIGITHLLFASFTALF